MITIPTADVRDIACLYFAKVSELAGQTVYQIDCDTQKLIDEIKTLLKHYEFNCYYDDFIREAVEENSDDIPAVCDRETFVQDSGS